MKPTPSQRRRGPRVALLALVLCSLLVPLAFVFDRAPAGTSLPPTPSAYPSLSLRLGVQRMRRASGGSGRLVRSARLPCVFFSF